MASKFKRTAKDLNNSVASTPMKPSPKVLKVNDEEESKLGKILEEIAQMNRKLDKLETIEEHLTRVDNDIKVWENARLQSGISTRNRQGR